MQKQNRPGGRKGGVIVYAVKATRLMGAAANGLVIPKGGEFRAFSAGYRKNGKRFYRGFYGKVPGLVNAEHFSRSAPVEELPEEGGMAE